MLHGRLALVEVVLPYSARQFTREGAISRYRRYILEQFVADPVYWARELKELSSARTLGCWCKPEACHGDVLVGFLSRYFAKERELTPPAVEAEARAMLAE